MYMLWCENSTLEPAKTITRVALLAHQVSARDLCPVQGGATTSGCGVDAAPCLVPPVSQVTEGRLGSAFISEGEVLGPSTPQQDDPFSASLSRLHGHHATRRMVPPRPLQPGSSQPSQASLWYIPLAVGHTSARSRPRLQPLLAAHRSLSHPPALPRPSPVSLHHLLLTTSGSLPPGSAFQRFTITWLS